MYASSECGGLGVVVAAVDVYVCVCRAKAVGVSCRVAKTGQEP